MPNHARHRRPSSHQASRTALTIAFTGATAALPLLGGVPAQASAPPKADPHPGRAATGGDARPRTDEAQVRVVRPGDDLYRIAAEFHVAGGWRALYADNRQTVGADPNLIRPGERLRIPMAAASPAAPRTHTAAPSPGHERPAPAHKPTPPPAAPHPTPAPPRPTPAPKPTRPAPHPTATTAAAPGPEGMPGQWTSVFDDEFNGDSLDTADWSTGWLASGITAPVGPTERECYDPSQVSVSGGDLHLAAVRRTEECGGQSRPYASGMVNTDGLHEFTEGAFEARIYLPAAPDGGVADWPAFWTDGQNWPTDGEMDVMEGLTGLTCFHYHSSAGAPGACANTGPGWHTFGAEWEDGTVTYYYDGHDVGSTSTGGTNAPQYLVLNNAVGAVGGVNEADDMLVDYVRVWKRTG